MIPIYTYTLVLTIAWVITLLMTLGLMREVVLLRADTDALARLVTRPPSPTFLGGTLPDEVAAASNIRSKTASAHHPEERGSVLIFVSPGCSACYDLLAKIKNHKFSHEVINEQIAIVITGAFDEDPLISSATHSFPNVLIDDRGRMATACEINGTPTLLAYWETSGLVFDWMMGGDVPWIEQIVSQRRPTTPLPTHEAQSAPPATADANS